MEGLDRGLWASRRKRGDIPLETPPTYPRGGDMASPLQLLDKALFDGEPLGDEEGGGGAQHGSLLLIDL